MRGLWWPLRIHDLPFRLVTQDRLQFAARIEHAAGDRDPSVSGDRGPGVSGDRGGNGHRASGGTP